MAITTNDLRVGDVLRYEDMANLPRTYIIVPQGDNPIRGEFRMRATDDLTIHYSDCRQHGWDLVEANR